MSVQTIARVLNGEETVCSDITKRVRRGIREMGEQARRTRRAMEPAIRRRGGAVAVVFCGMSSSWHGYLLLGHFMSGIEPVCVNHGRHMIVEMLPDRMTLEPPKCLANGQVEGLLVKASQGDLAYLEAWGVDCPVVVFSGHDSGRDMDQVGFENRGAATMLIEYLIDRGHKHIAMINTRPAHPHFRERVAGYRHALSQFGYYRPELLVEYNIDTHESDPALETPDLTPALDELLNQSPRPTAVMTTNDPAAAALYQACEKRGIHVGTDLSVTGFDDLGSLARELSPKLTTIALPFEEMTQVAAEMLFHRIESPGKAQASPSLRLLRGQLRERESVADMNKW